MKIKLQLTVLSRVCLSESVNDMNAYLFVTDEVLHQIRMLPSKGTEENKKDIVDAIEILDRINRRDLYRLVGESKITWKDQPNQEVYYNSHIFGDNVFATKTVPKLYHVTKSIMVYFYLR